jgi:hypothetical protein
MIEFGIYGLIVASTVLLSLNVMSVSFHFKEGFAKDATKKDSWLNRRLKSRIFSSIIISSAFTILSIVFIINIYDLLIASSKDIIWFVNIVFMLLIVLFTLKSSSYRMIDNQANEKIKRYFNNSINAFGFAILFSFILAVVYYQFGVVEQVHSLAEYIKGHLSEDENFTLYTFFEMLTVIKASFFHYLLQYIDVTIVKYIFAFLTFTQSFFLFYYMSILVSTIKDLPVIEDKSRNLLAPLVISLIVLIIFNMYQTEAIAIPKDMVLSTIKNEQNITNQINENQNLKAAISESRVNIERAEYTINNLQKEIDRLQNAKLSTIGLIKCSIPLVECRVKDIIKK